jgi:uncharacterized integral membrane protein
MTTPESPAEPEPDTTTPDIETPPATQQTQTPQQTQIQRVRAPKSRIGGVWVAVVLFALILLLLLIFVLENGQRAEISFFGQHGHLPQGVALLLAAVCGILLVAIPGTARIMQLRVRDRHHRSAAQQNAQQNSTNHAGQ